MLGECSGPWVGWSVQYNQKIHERLEIKIGDGKFAGTGEDADGDFKIEGDYDQGDEVAIVRKYTYCTLGKEGVGIPYLYRGRWDGSTISGEWKPVAGPFDGGPFEMWPDEPFALLEFDRMAKDEPVAV